MNDRYCIVLPHYNHHQQFAAMLPGLRSIGLPAFVIDDASNRQSVEMIETLSRAEPWLELHRRHCNGGKGAAVATGVDVAAKRGFSHVVQIDADGQHDPEDLPALMNASVRNPDAIVSGAPVFDRSVPASRLYGRKITNWWVHIETWSNDIVDPMCGFRIYPVQAFHRITRRAHVRQRMQFDIEFLVHAHWQGEQILQVPVKVVYPRHGLSHFRLFRDNMLISLMHARLVAGMLIRVPSLWARTRASPG